MKQGSGPEHSSGPIDPDALRLVVGLCVAALFVSLAVLLSASVVALTTYLAAALGSLTVLAVVLLWPDRAKRDRRNGKPFS